MSDYMKVSTNNLNTKGAQKPMESFIWFLGIVIFYFAMQLWILPKLGIQT
jgi:hypothetical protein